MEIAKIRNLTSASGQKKFFESESLLYEVVDALLDDWKMRLALGGHMHHAPMMCMRMPP